MTDKELRKAISESALGNGGYATKICRRCGFYWVACDGNTDTAVIVDMCHRCFGIKGPMVLH